MAKRSMFVGMDVHKESIDVSVAEEGRDGEVRRYGVIPGDLEAVAQVRALRAPNRRLRFVYEAGPCGCGIHRYLRPGRGLRRRQSLEHAEAERRSDQD
jgi:transposase